jgi:hypothetical protein
MDSRERRIHSIPLRSISLLLVVCGLLVSDLSIGQSRAPSCFFTESFDAPTIPAGWDIGVPIEEQDVNGAGTGIFTDAWRIGTNATANTNGYFNVPDQPSGNRFIMANDDASPCNCDMAAVTLTGPAIDLSGRIGCVLEYRIFHEGGFGVGNPILEVSDNGGLNWTTLDTILPATGMWQEQFTDISVYDGSPDFRIRILWSDSGNWGGGIAIDDICLSERNNNDLTLMNLFTADVTENPFDPTIRSLQYSVLPLTQADELIIGAELMNRGLNTLTNVVATISITMGGGIHTTPAIASLAPGERQMVFVNTGWTPTGLGEVQLNATSSHDMLDDDPTDDNGSVSFTITGAGAANGFAQMGTDRGIQEFTLDNDSNEVGMGTLIETIGAGDMIYGIGVLLDSMTAPGTDIQGVLLDGSLQFLDSTNTVLIDPSHIQQSKIGNFMYLQLDSAYVLTSDQDVYVMVYSTQAASTFLSVATSGTGPVGQNLFFDGTDDTWEFPLITPMVRAYFSDPLIVSVQDGMPSATSDLVVFPSPADAVIYLQSNSVELKESEFHITDIHGRMVHIEREASTRIIDVSNWNSGIYVATLRTSHGISSVRFVVAH